MTAILQAEGLRKRYGARVLLDIGRLQLDSGTGYLLMGGNGAGKTTLLRILAGLDSADTGRFTIDGERHDSATSRARLAPRLLYMHQHSCLFNTSVAENIAYGLRVAGVPRAERERLVAEQMAWAGVAHLAEVPPHRLSGGEKQRVALARARVLRPKLLLLDEPTANLDSAARGQVMALIGRMRRDLECVLVATHDPELMELPDMRHWTLADGRLREGLPG